MSRLRKYLQLPRDFYEALFWSSERYAVYSIGRYHGLADKDIKQIIKNNDWDFTGSVKTILIHAAETAKRVEDDDE